MVDRDHHCRIDDDGAFLLKYFGHVVVERRNGTIYPAGKCKREREKEEDKWKRKEEEKEEVDWGKNGQR